MAPRTTATRRTSRQGTRSVVKEGQRPSTRWRQSGPGGPHRQGRNARVLIREPTRGSAPSGARRAGRCHRSGTALDLVRLARQAPRRLPGRGPRPEVHARRVPAGGGVPTNRPSRVRRQARRFPSGARGAGPRLRVRGTLLGADRAGIRWRDLGRDRCSTPTAITGHHRQVVSAGAAVAPDLIHRRPPHAQR